ncbi:MAG: carbohydrate ABC transporter permease, partial [Lachnospiraceae bacterium]|nr:carbohydrate ABC transporter permease [Lachnospiraceae bacterium]
MKKIVSKTVLFVMALLLFLTTLVPVIWVLISSLKTKKEMIRSPWNFPEELQWSNYLEAWERGNFGQFAKNSVVITVTAVFLMLALSAMIAFALSRYQGKLGKAVLLYHPIAQTLSARSEGTT